MSWRTNLHGWRLTLLLTLAALCTACATVVAAVPVAQQTARPMQPISRPTAAATAYNACAVPHDVPTTRHIVSADIDYASRRVLVSQRVHYVNRTDAELTGIVMNVEPIHWPGVFVLNALTQDEVTLAHDWDGKQLKIDLPEQLYPGCETYLALGFSLAMPAVGEGVYARKGYFGYTARQLNLGHWLPTVAVFDDGNWVSNQFFLIGEQEVLDPADWQVTVNLVGETDDVQVIGPGVVMALGASRWRFDHRDARDFTLSLSQRFSMDHRETPSGVVVELYTFTESEANGAAFTAMDVAASSLTLFSGLFGEYGHPRLVLVEGDFPDGMEFSGLAFIGSHWFQSYPNTPASYLVLITVHEVAHQWWYGSVGNDSARHPWLDESLSTYSEYIFLEAYFPNLREWWWRFRVDPFSPVGDVGSQVYQFNTSRDYINAIYLNGVRMLHAVRSDLGTDAFYQFLADYAEAGRGQLMSPDRFWSQLSDEQRASTEATRRLYFSNP